MSAADAPSAPQLTDGAAADCSPVERWLRLLLLVLIFSLPFMQPPIALLGFAAMPGDFVFVALAFGWGVLIVTRRAPIVMDRAHVFLGLYLLAMVVSALAADDPLASGNKLLTQIYLLSLPVIVCSLVRDIATLRLAVRAWLFAAAVVAIVAMASLILFAWDSSHPLLNYTRFHFGTLPPGDYPRLRMTFLNANMACNYLNVSLILLLAAFRLKWVKTVTFVLLFGGILIAVATTISPGLGGVAAGLGLWLWLLLRDERGTVARMFLFAGAAAAILFVAAMAVTPINHPTAPFLIHLPWIDVTLAPAGRWMTWSDAARNFVLDPVFGRGIGSESVQVNYVSPSGYPQLLSDAHNMFLNIAVQCGLVGLAALLALIAHLWRRTLPLRLPDGVGVIRLAAGIALLIGLVYHGLGGSFEDARHLWVAVGLLVASDRIEHGLGRSEYGLESRLTPRAAAGKA